ncbi:hypothetical protein Agub_g8668, partial [Astrephomene gubernaculifera]
LKLDDGVTFRIQHLVVADFYNEVFSGITPVLFAPRTSGVAVLEAFQAAFISKACFPASHGAAYLGAVRRPALFPGTNTYSLSSSIPSDLKNGSNTCSNSTQAAPMERCWAHVAYCNDFACNSTTTSVSAPLTTVQTGYMLHLVETYMLCEKEMSQLCITTYNAFGCLALTLGFPFPSAPPPPPPPPPANATIGTANGTSGVDSGGTANGTSSGGASSDKGSPGSEVSNIGNGSQHKSGRNVGAAVGGSLGGAALVALLVMAAFLVVRRRRRQQAYRDADSQDQLHSAGAETTESPGQSTDSHVALAVLGHAMTCERKGAAVTKGVAEPDGKAATHGNGCDTADKGRPQTILPQKMMEAGSFSADCGQNSNGTSDITPGSGVTTTITVTSTRTVTVTTTATNTGSSLDKYKPGTVCVVPAAYGESTDMTTETSTDKHSEVPTGDTLRDTATPSTIENAATTLSKGDGDGEEKDEGEAALQELHVVVTPLTPLRADFDLNPNLATEVTMLPVVRGKGSFGTVREGRYGGERVAVKVLRDAYIASCGAAPVAAADPGTAAAAPGTAAAVGAAAAQMLAGGAAAGGKAAMAGAELREALRTFEQEVAVLGRCNHPNVVRLLAACVQPPRTLLVMELMETSLGRLLYGRPGQLLPLPKVLHIGTEIARALEYLHPTIVHRDLKPDNVLISQADSPHPQVKVSDFGLSRLRSTVMPTTNPGAGTPSYLAPECFDTNSAVITHHVDMYAWAVVVWAMLTGQEPWKGYSIVAIAYKVVLQDERLPLAEAVSSGRCPPRLQRLLERCWSREPARRPAAAEVVKEMMLVAQQQAS